MVSGIHTKVYNRVTKQNPAYNQKVPLDPIMELVMLGNVLTTIKSSKLDKPMVMPLSKDRISLGKNSPKYKNGTDPTPTGSATM